jgi:predicted subunit of tRNA(5-methylaminomethyl-2-thiouridylate) methyltransferase
MRAWAAMTALASAELNLVDHLDKLDGLGRRVLDRMYMLTLEEGRSPEQAALVMMDEFRALLEEFGIAPTSLSCDQSHALQQQR